MQLAAHAGRAGCISWAFAAICGPASVLIEKNRCTSKQQLATGSLINACPLISTVLNAALRCERETSSRRAKNMNSVHGGRARAKWKQIGFIFSLSARADNTFSAMRPTLSTRQPVIHYLVAAKREYKLQDKKSAELFTHKRISAFHSESCFFVFTKKTWQVAFWLKILFKAPIVITVKITSRENLMYCLSYQETAYKIAATKLITRFEIMKILQQ